MKKEIKLYGDYHTHTIYSSGPHGNLGRHATGSIEDNVKKAYELGLKEIAITDHGLGHYMFGVKEKNLPIIRKEIDSLNEIYIPKGLKIYMGVEANLMDMNGTVDLNDDVMKYFDIILMGFHYGVRGDSMFEQYKLSVVPQIAKISKRWRERTTEDITDAYIKAIEHYPINIITHPGDKIPVNIVRLAKACAERDVALEINASHKYLSVEDIKNIKDINVKIYVNSDAHKSEDVGNVKEGIRRASEAGLDLKRIINVYEV